MTSEASCFLDEKVTFFRFLDLPVELQEIVGYNLDSFRDFSSFGIACWDFHRKLMDKRVKILICWLRARGLKEPGDTYVLSSLTDVFSLSESCDG